MKDQRLTRLPHVMALLAAVCIVGCDPATPPPVDSSYAPPVLTNLRIQESVINTDTILVGSTPLPGEVITIRLTPSVDLVSSIARTTFGAGVRSSSGRTVPASSSFNDDGIAPDSIAADGRYAGLVTFPIERTLSGEYYLQISVVDANGLESNALTGSVRLVRANVPPVLSDLEADSIVSLSGGNTLLQLRIRATDQNGIGDIDRVWFDSFRPDSTPSSGNPFLMFDDGNTSSSGDQTAGDGSYALKVLFSGAAEGTYRFSFKARDRALDTSNVIDHFLTVVP